MGFQMGRIDHDDLDIAPLGGQFGKDARKNAKTALPYPAVIMDLSRFRSDQVLMLGGLSFEGHGAFPAQY